MWKKVEEVSQSELSEHIPFNFFYFFKLIYLKNLINKYEEFTNLLGVNSYKEMIILMVGNNNL